MKQVWGCLLLMACGYCCAEQPQGGYVVGNFNISAQINEINGPVSWIKTNPPKLGVWLQNFGRGELWLKEGNGSQRRLTLRPISVSREYPEYHAVFESEGELKVDVDVFAPLGLKSETNLLPAIVYRVRITAAHPWEGAVGYTLEQAIKVPDAPDDDLTPWPAESRVIRTDQHAAVLRGSAFLAVAGCDPHTVTLSKRGEPLSGSVAVSVGAGGGERSHFW